ncbi:hypothetical protein N2152v2_005110 [Parachlorella kessleri]
MVQALTPLVPKQPPPTLSVCLLPTFDGSLATLQAYNPQMDCSQPANLIPAYTTVCGEPGSHGDTAAPPPPTPDYILQPPPPLAFPSPPALPADPPPFASPPPPSFPASPPPYPRLPPSPDPAPLSSAPPPAQPAPLPGNPPPQAGPPPPWGPPTPQPYAQPPALPPDIGPPATWAAAAGASFPAARLAWPEPCCPGEDAALLAGAIGNGLFACDARCIYNPLPGQPGVARAMPYWVWSDNSQCWQQGTAATCYMKLMLPEVWELVLEVPESLVSVEPGTVEWVAGTAVADGGNPCGFIAGQEGRWASTIDGWWVADALLQRLDQAAAAGTATSLGGNSFPPVASSSSSRAEEAAAAATAVDATEESMNPVTRQANTVWGEAAEVALVKGWLGEELTTPWEQRNLSAAGEAVVALAASRFARDALLALPAEDPLRVWQEVQAPQRARDCRAAVEEGSSDEVAHCLCGPLEPLIYCRALEAMGRGWGLQALAARPSHADGSTG